MASDQRKREWFTLGAAAYDKARPGAFSVPTYVCPICRYPFTEEALDEKRLSVEHIPPESVGGRELVLTCTACNNSAGTKLDAAAKTKEDVRLAMQGKSTRPHRVKARLGDLVLNSQLHSKDGTYSLQIPRKINRPGTSDVLHRLAQPGSTVTVEHERYSELGARISWLRAAYLALFAMQGYSVVLDPAMDIVRQQIIECDERRMLIFLAEAEGEVPLTIRRVLKVLEPEWHRGWTVQFGRYLLQLPGPGDLTFYDRLARHGSPERMRRTTYQYQGWPLTPTFGQ